ncbi:DExH-box splicing factor binding site-domain-containing protein [Mycena floridula]|nr:DExH-box splicing factor binding site-domain-containing protein [Mycena floridula]
MSQPVSFTVRRPTPVSRSTSSEADSDSGRSPATAVPRHLTERSYHSAPGSPLARSSTSSPNQYNHDVDSSDEDDVEKDELVTAFDRFGAQRAHRPNKPEKQGPLVIAPLQNRDWRELARKRRSASQFVPASAKAQTGADGSVGGLGVVDSINSGPVLSGLQVKKKAELNTPLAKSPFELDQEEVVTKIDAETEDQIAIRALLAGADGQHDGPIIDIIPTPVSEADALKQDVEDLPESSSLDDYARVPVSQFGAALLRGMGWKDGTAASRKPGSGLVEPYMPASRPALLGIGAKEREILDDGSSKNASKRPERRYVPVVRQDKNGNVVPEEKRRQRSRSPRRSATSSRRNSPSPPRRDHRDRKRDSDRRDSDRHRDSDRRDRRARSRSREPTRKRDY